ncbi:NAD(P)/FAD-dependent oxidoreductase [Salimicrobium flavidum]|uniref:NADH dehydrogenase n=1 Tax=Salimicrobium flavidum TaxID=570947 RepID=A0A1N7JIN0_9BACI|nr:FAD-dependent oxidoreductase [Salimicrobium flavidum]SIS49106.1 NADH dehydrogenase [Salimicrobium flavidum]
MTELLILGGGYGGFKVLYDALENGIPDDVHITMVNRNPYHAMKTEYYAIAAGTTADRSVRVDFPVHEKISYVFDEVTKIDVEQDHVLLAGRDEPLTFDQLVIALGCEDNYHGIDGAKQFTESVQTMSAARHAGYEINNLKAYGNLTIVGAGLSGIEVAAETRESRPDLNIRLLDRGDTVLKAFDEKIQNHVEDWFKENEVNVIHGAKVEYVEKDGVCNNGICYMNDVTVWTAGVRPHYLARKLPFKKDEQEKLIANEFYQIPEKTNIFVLGDCVSSELSPSGQLAGEQGERIAEVLKYVWRGEEPKKPGSIKLKGTLGSLGKSDGFGNMMNQPLTGKIPRLAKSGVLWLHKRH